MLIHHARVFTGAGFDLALRIRLEKGAVAALGPALSPLPGEETVDLQGDYLLPGFVDTHIHGCLGWDMMAGEEALRHMSRGLYDLGVAAFCPTTMSASPEDTRRALSGVRRVMDAPEPRGARVLGAHMEAPFLSADYAGAQQPEFFADPSWASFEDMTEGDPGRVRIITLAPERAGSRAFIRRAAEAGVRVSLGHTAADAETIHRAADWGACRVTHTFNAQSPLHHRAPGAPGAALTDERLYCEMICDGIHLHRDTVRLILRCKGEKAVAVTDAMEAAGLTEGEYALGGQKVIVREGAARLQDGALAGSVLTMPQALQNLIHLFGIDPALACALCTSAPAESVGEKIIGHMAVGSPAPLTRWSGDWQMKGIMD